MAASQFTDSILMFDSYGEADQYIQAFEVENHCRFVKRDTRNHSVNKVSSLDRHSIRFEERNGEIPIGMDGVPFVILGSEVRECQYGPDRSKPKTKTGDHQYAEKSRKVRQHSKKHDCPALIRMRLLIKFPDYQIPRDSTLWRRKVTSRSLKDSFNSETTRQKYQILVKIENHHSDHLQGELSDFCQPLDKRVISKIHTLVEAGCHSVPQIQKDIEMFVKSDLGVGEDGSTNRRFFPRPQDIRNHMYNALKLSVCSEDDQTRVSAMVDTWRSKYPKDRFFFRPASVNHSGEEESFLFVHQTELQQRLLHMYGKDVVILDSTYKTSKYDIPLFLLCVLTNVGYHVVGLFLIGRETTLQIKGALQMLSSWNPSWSPTHFMTDLDHREITAIEETFTGTSVLTCEFHREQAWRRWLQRNGMSSNMTETLHQLRSIASSETEEVFRVEVKTLKAGQQYLTNTSFRNWIDKYWLQESKRWVSCYINLPVRVTTTNGLEAHNRVLKEKYLHLNNLKTMSSMLAVLIEQFIPESLNRYKEKNIMALQSHRRYTEDIPQFLRNRPKPFLDHCLIRLGHDSIESIQVTEVGFTVKSADSGNNYEVTLHPHVQCSCPDWKRFHWPCKHILNVIVQEPDVEWESLPESFTRQPWFLLDTSFEEEFVQNAPTEQEANPGNIPSEPCSSLDASFGGEKILNSLSETTGQARPTEPEQTLLRESDSVNLATDFIQVQGTGDIVSECEIIDPRTQRKLCLETVKNIQNSVYNVDDPAILNQVHKALVEIACLLDKNTSKLCNLPLWIKRGRKKRNLHNKAKNQSKNNHRNPSVRHKLRTRTAAALKKARQIQARARRGPSYSPTDAGDNIQCEEPPSESIDAVRQIWQSDAVGGHLIGRVGPYSITDSSVKFMQSTLSDETIDAYLHVLTLERTDVYHINCVTMTSIFTGSNYHGLLQHVDLLQYQTLLGAVNEGGCHWTLMIIHPHEKKLIYMNPLGELLLSEQQFLQHWYTFLRGRFVANLDDRATTWTISSPPHARQSDGTSCGLYVIKLAEHYLLGRNLLFVWSKEQILRMREYTAAFLISKAVRLPEIEVDAPPLDENISTVRLPEIEVDAPPLDENISTVRLPEIEVDAPPLDENISTVRSQEIEVDAPPLDENISTSSSVGPAQTNRHTKSAMENRTYNLRNIKEKRQSSSFIYPHIKRVRKRYCVCDSMDNGSHFWSCDACKKWFHPECLGYSSTESVPDPFVCPSCLPQMDKSCERKLNEESRVKKFFETFIGQEEDEDISPEANYFIDAETADAHIDAATARVRAVITGSIRKNDPLMKRHNQFKDDWMKVHKKGYGVALFSPHAILFISHHLKKQFYTDRTGKIYTRHGSIRGHTDGELIKLFQDKRTLAEKYLEEVLVPEAMAYIFQLVAGTTYEVADAECRQCEDMSAKRARLQGAQLCSSKKQFWLEKVNKR